MSKFCNDLDKEVFDQECRLSLNFEMQVILTQHGDELAMKALLKRMATVSTALANSQSDTDRQDFANVLYLFSTWYLPQAKQTLASKRTGTTDIEKDKIKLYRKFRTQTAVFKLLSAEQLGLGSEPLNKWASELEAAEKQLNEWFPPKKEEE